MKERKGGKYFFRNSIVLGWGTKYRIQLVLILRRGIKQMI